MNRPLVSVVIPVWGSVLYVKRTFTTLFEQTYGNIEYIVVNDCTPDSSMQIIESLLDLYPSRKSQVQIVSHCKNLGLAAARQSGLQRAIGDYIIFVDSDDYFEPFFIKEMVKKAQDTESDIVLCDYYTSYAFKELYVSQKFEGVGVDLCRAILLGTRQGFVWNKLIRRRIFVEHNINFYSGVNMWEDISVTFRASYYSSKVSYVPMALIHYNQENQNSYSVNRVSAKSLEDMIRVVEIVSDFFVTHTLKDKNDILTKLKLRAKFYCLINADKKSRKRFNELYPEIKWHCFYKSLHPIYANVILIAASLNFYSVIDFISNAIKVVKLIKYGK